MSKAIEDKAMTLAAEMSQHGGKLAEMANPSKGNKIIMTMACITVVAKARITNPAATMTKGKAPAAMTTRTQVRIDKEAIVAVETNRRTWRAKRNMTHPHHHQASPMAAAVVADQHAPKAPNTICHKKKVTMRAPDSTKLPSPKLRSSSDQSDLARKSIMGPYRMGSRSKRIFASTMEPTDH
jgi:hypothetical protein